MTGGKRGCWTGQTRTLVAQQTASVHEQARQSSVIPTELGTRIKRKYKQRHAVAHAHGRIATLGEGGIGMGPRGLETPLTPPSPPLGSATGIEAAGGRPVRL